MDDQGGRPPPVGSQLVEHPGLVPPDVGNPCMAGLDGAAPELAPPHTGQPIMVRPGTAAPGLGAPGTTAPRPGQPTVPVTAEVALATAVPHRSGTPAQPSSPPPQCPGQEALEL